MRILAKILMSADATLDVLTARFSQILQDIQQA